MDLSESPTEAALRERVRAWAREHRPAALATRADRQAWHRALLEAGFVGMAWPRAFGGQSAPPMEQAVVAEELARAGLPGTSNDLEMWIVGPTLMAHGTEAQKQRYLPRILRAEDVWCQLYSEPNAGSDLASLTTRAERSGNRYLVNGQKVWTSQGLDADYGILLARTDPHAPRHAGISYFIVPMAADGIEVRPLRQITGTAEFAEVFLRDVELPLDSLVGTEGAGWSIAQTTLGFERAANLPAMVARQRLRLARLLEVCRAVPHGVHARAIDDPLVRQKLGRMVAELEVLRYTALRTVSRLEHGLEPGAEASLDKLLYSEMEQRHQEAIQDILGPLGQLEEGAPDAAALHPGGFQSVGTGAPAPGEATSWAYAYLWSRAATIYGGASEIQRNIVGERLLGLPREPRPAGR